MFELIINKLKDFIQGIIMIDEKIGFRKFVKYILVLLGIFCLFNLHTITKEVVEFVIDISGEIHNEKLRLRDEYMTELTPLLSELRAETGADRILYFEFHNSEENLDGLPFKYFNLMLSNARYGIPDVPCSTYEDIGSGMYVYLFNSLSDGDILTCRGPHDKSFRMRFNGFFELLNQNDGAMQFTIFHVPGVKKPIGFIVLEWMDDTEEIDVNKKKISGFIPRINAISVSKFKN